MGSQRKVINVEVPFDIIVESDGDTFHAYALNPLGLHVEGNTFGDAVLLLRGRIQKAFRERLLKDDEDECNSRRKMIENLKWFAERITKELHRGQERNGQTIETLKILIREIEAGEE